MNRRSFGATATACLAAMCGLSKAKGGILKPKGITVHGPELIVIPVYDNRPALSLRFENVPFRKNSADPVRQLLRRLDPIRGVVNRSNLYWDGDMARARSLMFTTFVVHESQTESKNGVCSVVCAFKPSHPGTSWSKLYRSVDFETEILKALEGREHDGRETEAA